MSKFMMKTLLISSGWCAIVASSHDFITKSKKLNIIHNHPIPNNIYKISIDQENNHNYIILDSHDYEIKHITYNDDYMATSYGYFLNTDILKPTDRGISGMNFHTMPYQDGLHYIEFGQPVVDL